MLPGRLCGTYSSGDCPGIAPGSLFIRPVCRTKPITAAKVRAGDKKVRLPTPKKNRPTPVADTTASESGRLREPVPGR